ncbi:PRP38 family-domain-containing protein [Mycena rebaudengoi]|nr:PRP38 family-domain-containing protein [Mycena rebaudengoi]
MYPHPFINYDDNAIASLHDSTRLASLERSTGRSTVLRWPPKASLEVKFIRRRPEKEILVEYLRADEFKYLRALADFYLRMTFRAVDVFEPVLKDYRKLRLRNMAGCSLTYMDEFSEQLLTEERVCDRILPRLTKRCTLEENGEIGPRQSRLLDALEGKSVHGSACSHSPGRRARSLSRNSRTPVLTLARDTSLAALPALALVHAQSGPFARAAAYPS